jgi:hypothetical protein
MQWVSWLVSAPAALYDLHRLALWLEVRVLLYYLNQKPSGGASAFVTMQRFVEPGSQHVEHVRHVEQRVEDDEAVPGGDVDSALRSDPGVGETD